MKANELMIGDWVTARKWREKPFQLTRINENNKFFYGKIGDTYVGPFLIEELQPIPLTPEILEKNGWVSKRDGSGDFIYMRENTPGYGSNDMTVTKNIIGNFQMIHGSFNGIFVHYVHQLQHALHLCGIEKEITI